MSKRADRLLAFASVATCLLWPGLGFADADYGASGPFRVVAISNPEGGADCAIFADYTVGSDAGLQIDYTVGSKILRLILRKSNWNFTVKDTPVAMTFQFGLHPAWVGVGYGNAGSLTFDVLSERMQPFFSQFRESQNMLIMFPSGGEKHWNVDLTGSEGAVQRMRKCVLDVRDGVQSQPNPSTMTVRPLIQLPGIDPPK